MLRTFAALALIGTPALADEPPRSTVSQAIAKPECMCRLRSGTRVPLGTFTCLRVDGRAYLAQCRLSQNVSTWREVGKGCPVT